MKQKMLPLNTGPISVPEAGQTPNTGRQPGGLRAVLAELLYPMRLQLRAAQRGHGGQGPRWSGASVVRGPPSRLLRESPSSPGSSPRPCL